MEPKKSRTFQFQVHHALCTVLYNLSGTVFKRLHTSSESAVSSTKFVEHDLQRQLSVGTVRFTVQYRKGRSKVSALCLSSNTHVRKTHYYRYCSRIQYVRTQRQQGLQQITMFLRLALASLLVAADVAKGDTSTSDGDTSKLMVHVSRQGPKVVGTKPTETCAAGSHGC